MSCNNCGERDPRAFYASIGTYCKPCWRARVRANRLARIDYYREYDRARTDQPDRVAARKAYAERVKNTPHLRTISHARTKAWMARNNEKRRAHIMTGNAIKYGLLKKQPCVRCGEARVEAHHEDYLKPLDVTWLCKPCHAKRHREINAERRQAA